MGRESAAEQREIAPVEPRTRKPRARKPRARWARFGCQTHRRGFNLHAVSVYPRVDTNGILRPELQADCLAGAYLRSLPNLVLDRSDIREVASLAYRLGDYSWGRAHHGTPRQRVSAVIRGMEAADQDGLRGIRACFS